MIVGITATNSAGSYVVVTNSIALVFKGDPYAVNDLINNLVSPPAMGDKLLQESGDAILLESGDAILLE